MFEPPETDPIPTVVDGTVRMIEPPEPHAPTTAFPRLEGYEILDVLGGGGMGVVYKARELGLNRLVAIKMLRSLGGSDEERARFQLEAQSVAQLQHPHIVQVYRLGEEDGRQFFAMELVQGGTLAKHLDGKPLPNRAAAELVETLARAMAHAHERNIIHRDLKPANVLIVARDSCSVVREEGGSGSRATDHGSRTTITPKISDFGLAKQLDHDSGLTLVNGAILGTPSYMAPEQAGGLTSEIGPLTDVYGLGAILYECLTGQAPFRANTAADTLRAVQENDPETPSRRYPRVHRDLETICLKCLAKRPARRYSSALALAEDLRRYLDGEPILARREAIASRLWRKLRRHLVTAVLLIAVLAATVSAVVISINARSERERTHRLADIEQALTEVDGSLTTVRAVEEKLDALGDEERAAQARQRLHQRCASLVNEGLRAPRLDPAAIQRIDAILAVLNDRVPEEAARLREALKRRWRNWDPIFNLTAPFADRKDIFEPGLLAEETKNLRRRDGSGNGALLTRISSEGNVQLEAWLAREQWKKIARLGLILQATPGAKKESSPGGYYFIVASSTTLGECCQRKQTAMLQVFRNRVKLHESRVKLADGVLHLLARREGDRLLFQVNDHQPLEVYDLFPLRTAEPGVLGFVLPEGVGLQRLQAMRQSQPLQPSPLEKGDEYFARNRISDAKEEYRKQGQIATGDEQREARYKHAICLIRLQRAKDAIPLLRQVAADTEVVTDRWRASALCQLWLLEVRQGNDVDADAVLRRLGSEVRFAELAALVPDEIREQMIEAYVPQGTFDLLRYNPRRVANLERALQVQTLLQAPANRLNKTREVLLEVLLIEDKLDRAIFLAEEMLKQPRLSVERRLDVMQEYACMLLRRGQPQRAMDEVNRYLLPDPAQSSEGYRKEYLPLLVTRARIHTQQKRLKDAEHDLDELFARTKKPPDSSVYLDAWLLKGCLREQQGDKQAAQKAWSDGLKLARDIKALHVLPGAIMGSLSGELTTADARLMVAGVLGGADAKSPLVMMASAGLFPFEEIQRGLRATWRGPRGREWARRIAAREATYEEMLSVQAILGFCEGSKLGAFPGEVTPEQDALLWKLFSDIYRDQASGKLTQQQIVSILGAWTGVTGPFGWGDLTTLPPHLRVPLAYLYAHRSLRLDRKDAALMYLRCAQREAPSGSVVKRLAETELAQLGAR